MPRYLNPDDENQPVYAGRSRFRNRTFGSHLNVTNISLEGLAHELARNQNYLGSVSGTAFSEGDELWVDNSLRWKSIDTRDAWCSYLHYPGSGDKTEFLESEGLVNVSIAIVDSQSQECYVRDKTYD